MTSEVLKEIVLVEDDRISGEVGDSGAGDSTSLGIGVWVSNTIFNFSKRVELAIGGADSAVSSSVISLNVTVHLKFERNGSVGSDTISSSLSEGGVDLNSLSWELGEKDITGNVSIIGSNRTINNNDSTFSEHALGGDARGDGVLDERGRVLLVGSPPGAVVLRRWDGGSGSGSVALMAVAGGGVAVAVTVG